MFYTVYTLVILHDLVGCIWRGLFQMWILALTTEEIRGDQLFFFFN